MQRPVSSRPISAPRSSAPATTPVGPRRAARARRWALGLTLGVAGATAGACVHAPAVIIVDRKTALEQQASGSFRGLEEDLEQAGVQPRPTPLTSAQLAEAGVNGQVLDEESQTGASAGNDAVRTDALLVQRCIGETLAGTLALTIDQCTGTIDVPEVNRLIERVNRERRQLWRWLGERAKGRSAEDVRGAWRETHLTGLICGAQLQVAGGDWEIKRC